MTTGRHFHGTTFAGGTTTDVGQILSLSVSGRKKDAIDVSSNSSTDKFREFVPGMIDEGEIQVSVLFSGITNKCYSKLDSAFQSGTAETWTLTFPDTSVFSASGFITNLSVEGGFEDKITASFTIKLAGAITFTDVPA